MLQPFSMCEEIMHDVIPYLTKNVNVSMAMTCINQLAILSYIDNNGFRVDFKPEDIPKLMNDLTCDLFCNFMFSYNAEGTDIRIV